MVTNLEHTNMSIELGFNGELSKAFYQKWELVKEVRFKLKKDLIGALFILNIFSIFFIITFGNLWYTLPSISLILLSSAIICKNLKVWYEIKQIKKERFIEYNRKC